MRLAPGAFDDVLAGCLPALAPVTSTPSTPP
jgi:hypothetical protein